MSTLAVVADVLREVAPRALCAREIADLAGARLPTASRTPQTVVSRDLALDVKKHGNASRFLRVAPGEFMLKEAMPTAFYNDVDGYAAAWTRNLVAAGEIAAGVVDERSIRDLKPADVAGYRQCHFFSGIGIWSRALQDAGWPDDAPIWTGSCPCQGMSSAGRRLGFADERHLWPEWFRLIRACRPPVLLTEQVASKDGIAWLNLVHNDLEGIDYVVRSFDLPACCVGAPHRRQRLYVVAYARERGCEILGSTWLHDRRQPGHDVARCSALDGSGASAISDTAVARCDLSEDARADRGDACEGAEAIEWRSAGNLEPQRGSAPDEAGAVSDAECFVRDAGRAPLAHGRTAIELDGHGEAHGADGMGDAGLARGGRDAGALPRAEGVGEGEWIEARDLTDEPLAPGAAHDPGYQPGDRIRIDGDPGWGGAVRGFWADDVEWIYCRPEPGHQDGRWRPARAGIEPLVAGPATELGRTRAARLRGFGNSIVLPLAKEFVSAVIEAFADAALADVAQQQQEEDAA